MNKIFYFFFKMAIKIAESALKCRVGRVSGNTAICFLGLMAKTFMVNSNVVIPFYYSKSKCL